MTRENKRAASKERNQKLINYLEKGDLIGMVNIMTPFINMMAHKLHYSSLKMIEVNDLISNGYIGLLDAISKFNLDKSKNLKSYAEIRIKGAMLDYVRSQDKLPRSMRDKINGIQKAKTALQGKLGRKPTDLEIAKELSLETVEDYYKHRNSIKTAFYINFKDFYPNSDKSFEIKDENSTMPHKSYESKTRDEYLTDKISCLKPKQKQVIEMHYLKEMDLKEISKVMNLTESRISQLHLAALKVLRNELNPEIMHIAN